MYKKNEYFRIPILLVDKDLSSPNPSYGKTVDQLKSLADEEINNGTQYLKLVAEIIEANAGDFNQCEFPLVKNSKSLPGYEPYNTKGVFGL